MDDYFVHESSYIDEGVSIGRGTKIWHFCHIQKGLKLVKIVPWAKMSILEITLKLGMG